MNLNNNLKRYAHTCLHVCLGIALLETNPVSAAENIQIWTCAGTEYYEVAQNPHCWEPVFPEYDTQAFVSNGGTLQINSIDGEVIFDWAGLRVGTAESGTKTGTVDQSASILNVNGIAYVGDGDGATGIYNLSNGTLNAKWERIGFGGGTGTLNQTGGTHNISGNLYVGDGTHNGSISDGTYNLSAMGVISVNGAEYIGANGGEGTFNQAGGTHEVNGNLFIGSGVGSLGTYNLSGGTLKTDSETIGDGGSGSFYQTGGTHTVGTLLLGNGITGFGSYALAGGMLEAKIIDLKTGGGEANFGFSGGAILSVEEFMGNLLNNGGILSPGSSPGTTLIDGYYVQSSLGSLLMEFDGGDIAGTNFDLLSVTGTAYLGGTLIVSFWDGFIPADGSIYTFLTAEAIIGTFDFVSLPTLADWNFLLDYSTDSVSLRLEQVSAVPIPPALWLFGSGLLGLIGVARRKKVD